MAHQKPIVATKVGGIPELVIEGKSGFVVERGNVCAMAEKILHLAERPELREQLGRAGRQIAEAQFDLRRNVRQLIELYGVQSAR